MMRAILPVHCLCLLVPSSLHAASGVDWTGWRGPHGNGTTTETGWDPKALDEPRVRWTSNVGCGHGAVVVEGDRLYVMGNRWKEEGDDEDVILCLDANTGEEAWRHVYPCAEREFPGPCSTPLLLDGRLYTLSREGHFLCLDAAHGEVLWQRHLVDEGLSRDYEYFASSPIPCGELVVLNVNSGGMAFDPETGRVVWNSEPDDQRFASPVVFAIGEEQLLVVQSMDELRALDPGTGEALWSLDRGGMSDPVFPGEERMLVFGSRDASLYDVGKGEPELLWTSRDGADSCQSYVVVGGFVYGFVGVQGSGSSAALSCLSLADGSEQWATEILVGGLIAAGDKLVVVDQFGKLYIAEAAPEGFDELSSTQAIDLTPERDQSRGYWRSHACWTNPVLSHGKIYVRSTYGELVCIDVS